MSIKSVDSTPHRRSGRLVRNRAAREYDYRPSKSRLYVGVDSERGPVTVGAMMDARWENPVRQYRKALPAIFAALGLDPATKARWSQYAGCGCPCSPGFILDTADGRDHFATISPEGVREAA